ncbi:MAG: alpha/beta hydrolase [Marinoscillum sp.]|uniref:alpha/beta hydrolase n=1 Tax=Marinoscillum sp. TaxID=2024838 RepID=UPI0032FF7D7B
MDSETEYFLSQDGLRLYYRHWDCEHPRKMLCIIHGLGEHSNRHRELAAFLNSQGITVFAMDLRGHGLSQGKRGHARSYPLLLSDIEELLKTARAEYTELPMYLLGQSMGGNLVANYALKMNTTELSGFVLTSPWFRLAFEPPKWKVALGKLVSGIFPALTQPNDLNAADLSKDPAVVEAYNTDPMVHRVISAGLFTSASAAGEEALQRAPEVKIKGLVIHGNADPIVSWKASESYAEQNELLEWVKLENVLHEPFQDLGKETVMQRVAEWILAEA